MYGGQKSTNLEAKVKNCATGQSQQKTPSCSPLHPWEWPERPWWRDFAGPFMEKMFLLIIDAHSKWMDIHCVNSATSSVTIHKMRSIFFSHGLPEIVVSNNGSNFVSRNLSHFFKKMASSTLPQHLTTQVQMVWLSERYRPLSKGSVDTKLARFLLSYRITPQSSAGESPA